MLMVLSLTCFATTIYAEPPHVDEPYIERGEINLDGLKMKLENNEIKVMNQRILDRSTTERITLLQEKIIESPELKTSLKSQLSEGKEIKAIGYATVYLKDVKDENGISHVEPMTKQEYQLSSAAAKGSGTGISRQRGKLTLYTSASITYRSGNRYIGASTVAQWGYVFLGSAETTANGSGLDMITCSVPDKYTITNSYMSFYDTKGSPLKLRYYPVQDWKSVVVHEFAKEQNTKNVLTVSGRMTDSGARQYIKVSSQYLHVWTSANVSVGLTSAGIVSFNLSGSNKAWQLASSVSFQE